MIVWPDCRFVTADCNWLTLETLMTVPVGAGRGGTLTLFGKVSVLVTGLTVSVYARLPVTPAVLLSVAVIVNEELPEVLGVPLSTPVLAFSPSHDGRLPDVTAKV